MGFDFLGHQGNASGDSVGSFCLLPWMQRASAPAERRLRGPSPGESLSTQAAWPRAAQLGLLGLPGPSARFSHEGLSDSRPQSSKQEFGNDLTLLPSLVQLPFDPQVGTDEDCLL